MRTRCKMPGPLPWGGLQKGRMRLRPAGPWRLGHLRLCPRCTRALGPMTRAGVTLDKASVFLVAQVTAPLPPHMCAHVCTH